MKNKFLEKAIARITPEERALMVKSLAIISQIHEILDRKKISQKGLAEGLKVTEAAVSKMLSPGGNLGINTLIKLELLLGEIIITTPKKVNEAEKKSGKALAIDDNMGKNYLNVTYIQGESGLYINSPLMTRGAN